MRPVILARSDHETGEEFVEAGKHFPLYTSRTLVPENSLVIGRYSVLPYYRELEEDLQYRKSTLVNSTNQHNFCADIFQWYPVFRKWTPSTWKNTTEIPSSYRGSFIVKGTTNSRKHEWNKRMFAKTEDNLPGVINSLLDDSLISEQGLCIREYIPLRTYFVALNGLPVTHEYRFFCFDDSIISSGFYWSSMLDDLVGEDLKVPKEATEFVKMLLRIDKKSIINFPRFFVLDVALTDKGHWILIEVNDGQMSGLSENKPSVLYKNLQKAVENY